MYVATHTAPWRLEYSPALHLQGVYNFGLPDQKAVPMSADRGCRMEDDSNTRTFLQANLGLSDLEIVGAPDVDARTPIVIFSGNVRAEIEAGMLGRASACLGKAAGRSGRWGHVKQSKVIAPRRNNNASGRYSSALLHLPLNAPFSFRASSGFQL
jgi:hypothetical protein